MPQDVGQEFADSDSPGQLPEKVTEKAPPKKNRRSEKMYGKKKVRK